MSDAPSPADRIAALEKKVAELEARVPEDRVTLVAFSGELDRILAAFVIATGAAAMGQQVSIFFTFWGINAVRRRTQYSGKRLTEKMMAFMAPGGSRKLPVSKMNYFGIGAKMLRGMMKNNNVASLEDLMSLGKELGIRLIACTMSRDVMGIRDTELFEGMDAGGVGAFLGDALRSRVTLFI
jgi:peroxiredoxin family protein